MIDEILELSGTEAEKAYLLQTYVKVGELMLITSFLERQVNFVCIAVLALGDAVMIEPIVASIDGARKIEILKCYAAKISAIKWRKALIGYAKSIEAVNRVRNIAAHGVLQIEHGKAVLMMPSAARLLKAISLKEHKADKTPISALVDATEKARLCIVEGENILLNFERVTAARLKIAAIKDASRSDHS